MVSYIFAYGSLVDKESRETTLKTDLVYPCVLQDHFIRFWTYHPNHQDHRQNQVRFSLAFSQQL